MDAKPQVIKVSSKRQITIPAKLYQALGFSDHAWCMPLGDGLYLCPAVEGRELDADELPDAPRTTPSSPAVAPAQRQAKRAGVWSVFGETGEPGESGAEEAASLRDDGTLPASSDSHTEADAAEEAAEARAGGKKDASATAGGEPSSRGRSERPRVRPLLGIASEPAIRDDEYVGAVVAAVRTAAIDYPAIKKIFLFGAFARGDYDQDSRLDLRLELDELGSFGLHDLMVFARNVEQATGRRANVVSARHLTNQELAASIERDKVLVFEQ